MGNSFGVLGFPCNQFGLQEPGANSTEILNGIKYVRPGKGFVPNFHMFDKIEVNGDNEHPLYTFLKKRCPSTRSGFADKSSYTYDNFLVNDVRWNFEKFLINRDGIPVKRYDASTHPFTIQPHIEEEMRRPNHDGLHNSSTSITSSYFFQMMIIWIFYVIR